jgi:hypothetical protein
MRTFFKILIAIQTILAALFFTVFADSCGSGCGTDRSLLFPFGSGELAGQGLAGGYVHVCSAVCTRLPHPYFYITVDLLLGTLVVFAIYLFLFRKR